MTSSVGEEQAEFESAGEGRAAGPAPRQPAEPLLNVDDVCGWLNVARHWVYDEVEARRLTHVRLGRRSLRFRRSDIQSYLEQRTMAATPTPQEHQSPPYVVGFEELESLD